METLLAREKRKKHVVKCVLLISNDPETNIKMMNHFFFRMNLDEVLLCFGKTMLNMYSMPSGITLQATITYPAQKGKPANHRLKRAFET